MSTKLFHLRPVQAVLVVLVGLLFGASPSWASRAALTEAWNLEQARSRLHAVHDGTLIRVTSYRFDVERVDRAFETAPHRYFGYEGGIHLAIPTPTGELAEFRVVERSVLSVELQQLRPQLRTYVGVRVGDEGVQIRITRSPSGMQARVLGQEGWTLDSMNSSRRDELLVWKNADDPGVEEFRCLLLEIPGDKLQPPMSAVSKATLGSELRVYQLAVSATGEFTQFHGSVANAEAQITSLFNLANVYFERDLAVRMQLVDLNVYDDPATDPFSNGTVLDGLSLMENHDALTAKLGSDGFDLGHLVSRLGASGWSGLAQVGAQCDRFRQGYGAIFAASPTSGSLLEGVLHEVGHQLGAHHSFNGTAGSCGGNRSASWAYEIASGVSLMSYAGICAEEDVTSPGFFMYNGGSIEAITNTVASNSSCGSILATGNTPPVADAGPDYTIPLETAFVLDGSSSFDPDLGALTFSWEQHDLGPPSPPYGPAAGPLLRNYKQISSPLRSVPEYMAYRNGAAIPFEFLPTVARDLTMRLIVRDNSLGGGGVSWDTAVITASGDPFRILSPNGGETLLPGLPVTASWELGGGGSAANVRIQYSTDRGTSWTEIVASTPNDGSEEIIIPCEQTTEARIRIEPLGNIFFDISDGDFTVTADDVDPTITCPAPFEVTATSESGIDKDDPALSAWIASATASDNCDPNPTIELGTSQTIPIGVNTVAFIARDLSGNFSFCATELTVTTGTAAPQISMRTALLGVHPNPFNPRTTISFQLQRAQSVRLEILDVRGRRVEVLHEGAMEQGRHDLSWDGGGGASGVYFARLLTEDGTFQQRLVLLK